MVTDTNPLDKESYKCAHLPCILYVRPVFFYTHSHEHEVYLQENAGEGIQLLIALLFSFPTVSSPEGPLGQLPTPTTRVQRGLVIEPRTSRLCEIDLDNSGWRPCQWLTCLPTI
ncbi:hypothetical protein V8E52_009171 [Russula decolorans]